MATFNLIVYILQHDLWEGLIKEAVIDILKYVTDVLLCMLLLFSEVWFSFVLSLNNLNMVYCPACSFTKIGDPPIGLIEKYHKLFMPGIFFGFIAQSFKIFSSLVNIYSLDLLGAVNSL